MTIAKEKTYNRLCAAGIVGSVLLSVILISLGDSPRKDALSVIGSANRELFFMWGTITGAATYFNLHRLAAKLEFKSKAFEWILAVGCSMILLTISILGYQTLNRIIHVGSALAFGLSTVGCLLWLIIVKCVKRKDIKVTATYICAMVFAAIIFIVTSIQVGWFTAVSQVLLANVCLAVIFSATHLENFSPDEAQATAENISELEAELLH